MKVKQLQRDIQWILDCPDLLEGEAQHLRLQNISISAEDRFEPFTHKVGRYFEHLVSVMLRNSADHELHDQSVQIIRDGRTLGELDFVYSDRTSVITHCEVAIKYYLYYPDNNSTGSHFIGPNPEDAFENKVSRLISHQLPLSKTYYTKAKRRETFVKGCIFYPYGSELPTATPLYLSREHLRGTWLYARDVANLANYTNAAYCICRKPNWLGPPMDEDTFLSPRAIVEWAEKHFEQTPHPLMLSRLHERQGKWVEKDRLFVVPDRWPHKHL